MNEIEVNKAFITAINAIVLLGLPFMLWWHIRQAKKKIHLSDDWIIQILICFVYALSISAEIPALWARWIAYYTIKMTIPDGLYKLTAWDRFSHMGVYAALFLLTYTFTRRKIPKQVRDMLS